MVRELTCSVALALLTAIAAIAQPTGPWQRERNTGYAEAGAAYMGYNSVIDADGNTANLRRGMLDITSHAYVEYGLTDRLLFSARLPFKYAASSASLRSTDYFNDTLPSGEAIGLQAVMLAFSYNIINKKTVLTAGLSTESNVSVEDSVTALRTGPSTFVIHPYLSSGIRLGKFSLRLDAGYRLRLKGYSDEVSGRFDLAFSPNEQKTVITATVTGLVTMKNGTYDNGVTPDHPFGRDLHTLITPNNQTLLTYGLRFSQRVKRVSFHAEGHGLFGQLVPVSPLLSLAVGYTW